MDPTSTTETSDRPHLPDGASLAESVAIERNAVSSSAIHSGAVDGAREEQLPTLSDGWVRALLLFTCVLQLLVWSRIRGYSIADSVEFMERAQTLVHSERTIDEGVIRPFGFSSVLLPFFVVADWFGIVDPRPIAWCVSLLQMGLALCLVFVSARVAALIAGRRAGLVAGLIVGTNPIFLQYSTQPVSDIAAALFIALALEALLAHGSFKRGLVGGLWLGAALLMAYKSLLVIGVIVGVVFLRDGWARRVHLSGILCGVLVGIAAQALTDRLMFGSFGVGFVNYIVQNVLSVLVSVAVKYQWDSLSMPLYTWRQELMGNSYDPPDHLVERALQESWYYFHHLPQMLVWPVIGLVALGVLDAIRRPSWNRWLVIIVLVASVAIMSNKGSKDYRIWLPLMPLVGALCACGWNMIFGRSGERAGVLAALRARALRPVLAVLLLAAIVIFDARAANAIELQRYGGYWSAIDYTSQHASETYAARAREALSSASREVPPPRLKVACAYNWAVYMRQSPLVELVKLPWQLNFWNRYGDDKKTADMSELAEIDIFITHLPTLTENPDLLEWVNSHFEVQAGFFDQRTFDPGLGPILVLERRSGRSNARTFFDSYPSQAIEPFRISRELPPVTDFIDAKNPDGDRLVFLGYRYEILPGDQHGWMTYYWTAPKGVSRDYHFIDRITSPDETNTWQNNHAPAWGMLPTSAWAAGEIVSEGFPVVACADPYDPAGKFRPIGGPYRRGDWIPARLWMAATEYDPAKRLTGQLVERSHLSPAAHEAAVPYSRNGAAAGRVAAPEAQFSDDGLFRVGAFFVPVHPTARLQDDGKPIVQ
jgi:4-amino-4-deoxy-L-arabinose transferase-like glycosyltransferase